tara:strand:- start:17205 stop:19580 length:2376 start_codon:yes stop_codon:yes gene_type:complete
MILRQFFVGFAIFYATIGSLGAQSLAEGGILSFDEPAIEVAAIPGVELVAWDVFAKSAEEIVETGTASAFALTRIRAELVIWRDQFFEELDINSARLATITKQITAVAAPDGEDLKDPVLIARLEVLSAERARLRRPYVLANEAYVHAAGLLSEVDAQIRQREAARLSTRSQSPANPSYWGEAFDGLLNAVNIVGRETVAASVVLSNEGRFWSRLAMVVLGTIAALVFVMRIRAWVGSLKARPLPTSRRGAFAIRFVLSLGSVVLPVLGLSLLSSILMVSGFVGLSGRALVRALPVAGGLVFVAKWLADWYFPVTPNDDGLLGYDQSTRIKARRLVVGLGWTLGIGAMVIVQIAQTNTTDLVKEVVGLPFQVLVGVLLWQLGGKIARLARPETTAIFKRNLMRKFIGRMAQALAVLGPMASTLGYAAAAQMITGPSVLSLALFATIVVFQRLSFAMTTSEGETSSELEPAVEEVSTGLLPVGINIGLVAVCLPLLALIWGASTANLVELWTRFRAGFSIGDVNISPSSFVTFVVVLVLGYLLTGLIKSGLKATVLPRTQLDLGGQNAVVAGTGYVGISLSALAAFTFAGIDLSSLAIVAGALSVGIGFGLQNIVQNFVAGIILLIERPVSEGDMIEVGGQMGYVRDISVRSTRIETFDRTDVIVPNADLISNQVTNWTRGNSVGRAIIPVGVAYGSDTKQVAQILREAAEAHPMVLLNPPPGILLIQFGADSIDFEIRAIIRDVNFVMLVKSEILLDLVDRFEAAGIEIPFAQRDIWLRNPEMLNPRGSAE